MQWEVGMYHPNSAYKANKAKQTKRKASSRGEVWQEFAFFGRARGIRRNKPKEKQALAAKYGKSSPFSDAPGEMGETQ